MDPKQESLKIRARSLVIKLRQYQGNGMGSLPKTTPQGNQLRWFAYCVSSKLCQSSWITVSQNKIGQNDFLLI